MIMGGQEDERHGSVVIVRGRQFAVSEILFKY